ncbi:hypothetical protein Pmani_040121 [Petrolisthes manimaculis]|uniref:Uncharacterized protein n=1 Tax=Petrolisthes manimaculis TaxID=1843537 RepID=A0AAE1TKM2_9EUCA|nr:hypothetical protein Pmani_040121 [Petrolisthes manimaculis]
MEGGKEGCGKGSIMVLEAAGGGGWVDRAGSGRGNGTVCGRRQVDGKEESSGDWGRKEEVVVVVVVGIGEVDERNSLCLWLRQRDRRLLPAFVSLSPPVLYIVHHPS